MSESNRKKRGMSVTQCVRTTKQPYGGYIKRADFTEVSLGGGKEELHEEENVHGSLIGLTVDYMTRFLLGSSLEEAFSISLIGASIIGDERVAHQLLSKVKGLDAESITSAMKLTGYDVIYRNGVMGYKPVGSIEPDSATIENVKIMIERTLAFFEIYGPVVLDGFNFLGAYTEVISTGDGDFLTEDTLWDMKVLKGNFQKKDTLQLLIYWRMGRRSINHKMFENIKYLGIYNPRQNKVFRISISDIANEIINIVDYEIIGYLEGS